MLLQLRPLAVRPSLFLDRTFSTSSYGKSISKPKFIPRSSGVVSPKIKLKGRRLLSWERYESAVGMAALNDALWKKGVMKYAAWIGICLALSGISPLVYRAICLQQEGALSNEANHKQVAPQMPDDGMMHP